MNDDQGHASPSSATTPCDPRKTDKKSLSMHDGVEVWEDCCSCEAEPYWLDAFADSRTERTENY
jgi:hypothetical protein